MDSGGGKSLDQKYKNETQRSNSNESSNNKGNTAQRTSPGFKLSTLEDKNIPPDLHSSYVFQCSSMKTAFQNKSKSAPV